MNMQPIKTNIQKKHPPSLCAVAVYLKQNECIHNDGLFEIKKIGLPPSSRILEVPSPFRHSPAASCRERSTLGLQTSTNRKQDKTVNKANGRMITFSKHTQYLPSSRNLVCLDFNHINFEQQLCRQTNGEQDLDAGMTINMFMGYFPCKCRVHHILLSLTSN